jgi:hypothetical protein
MLRSINIVDDAGTIEKFGLSWFSLKRGMNLDGTLGCHASTTLRWDCEGPTGGQCT